MPVTPILLASLPLVALWIQMRRRLPAQNVLTAWAIAAVVCAIVNGFKLPLPSCFRITLEAAAAPDRFLLPLLLWVLLLFSSRELARALTWPLQSTMGFRILLLTPLLSAPATVLSPASWPAGAALPALALFTTIAVVPWMTDKRELAGTHTSARDHRRLPLPLGTWIAAHAAIYWAPA